MCYLCMRTPCAKGCPNAKEEKPIYSCKSCGWEIDAGEEYAKIGRHYYHLDCLEDMPVRELLKELDVDIERHGSELEYEYATRFFAS